MSQQQDKNLLFVCSHNQRRSITAARLFDRVPGYATLSAGTERGARQRVNEELLQWADLIFVMEQKHVMELHRKYRDVLRGKRLICLQVPDRYGCMSFELIDVLKEKLRLYVDLPR